MNVPENPESRADYIRSKSPRILFAEASRSWYDRTPETDDQWLEAYVAAAVADRLSDEALVILGPSQLRSLAVALLDTAGRPETDRNLESHADEFVNSLSDELVRDEFRSLLIGNLNPPLNEVREKNIDSLLDKISVCRPTA